MMAGAFHNSYAQPHRQGYSLVELLVVLAILGVLAAAIMPLGEALTRGQKERELRMALLEIRTALDEHKRLADKGYIKPGATESGYPANLQSLALGLPDGRPGYEGQTVYLLRRIPRDPFAAINLPAEATWRLRSYASPPERPAPGADVFDITSSSDERATDGSYYREW
jgi:general secretion pathway protein G